MNNERLCDELRIAVTPGNVKFKLLNAAADEIERLRAEVERLKRYDDEIKADLEAALLASQAEVVRLTLREKVLREALEDYFRQYPHMMKGYILDAISQPTDDAKDGHPADLALRNYVADEMLNMLRESQSDQDLITYPERYRKGEV